MLVQPRKTRPNITEKIVDWDVRNHIKQTNISICFPASYVVHFYKQQWIQCCDWKHCRSWSDGFVRSQLIWIRGVFKTRLVQSKLGGKDQESIQSSTTPDSGHHMGKWQNTINITYKRAKRPAFSMQVTTGDHKVVMKTHQRHCAVSFRKTLYPLLSTGSTQEDKKTSQHDWNIVDWFIKH